MDNGNSIVSVQSVVRTVVPFLVAAIVAGLAKLGTSFDSATLTNLVTVVVGGAYYTVVRFIESKYPAAGWLLGQPGAPAYGPTPDTPLADVPDPQK